MKAIGLMSGTSMDGIDAALIETDGERIFAFGPAGGYPYTCKERELLRQAMREAQGLTSRDGRRGILGEAEAMLTARHAEAVNTFIAAHKVRREEVAAIGFHGQTVLHRPEQGLTVQLGDGQALAGMTGIGVVYDFRAADVAAGGQGAPLAPVYHRALADMAELPRPVAVLNIGGVANVTWIGPGGELLAFDTGPGNALIDDWALQHTGEPMDRDGGLALSGRPDRKRLEVLLGHPYFAAPPPKSLDRNAFSSAPLQGLDAADGAATLTAFSAAAAALALPHFPEAPELWVLTGGGARNPALRAALTRLLPGGICLAEDVGWTSDYLEAQAFAFLAVRTLRHLPLSYPCTTGAAGPLSGGVYVLPSRGRLG